MEAPLGILMALLASGAVHAGAFAVINSGPVDALNGGLQVVMHGAIEDGMADVVAKVEGADEQDINARDSGDLVDLVLKSDTLNYSCKEVESYILQRFLGLNLCNGDQGVIGLLKILDGALVGELSHGEG